MKQWSDNHPKGKLLARKRAAILEAAQDAFLRLGYDGASMEGIASAAGVSIMTLYRHAKRKEDLFAAVIANTCGHFSDDDEQAELEAMLRMDLRQVLIEAGVTFQDKLASPRITALLRVVITEMERFPTLADMVYRAFFERWEVNLDAFLARHEQANPVGAKTRRTLCQAFFNRLVGTDAFRVLLGMKGIPAKERLERAHAAADAMLEKLGGTVRARDD